MAFGRGDTTIPHAVGSRLPARLRSPYPRGRQLLRYGATERRAVRTRGSELRRPEAPPRHASCAINNGYTIHTPLRRAAQPLDDLPWGKKGKGRRGQPRACRRGSLPDAVGRDPGRRSPGATHLAAVRRVAGASSSSSAGSYPLAGEQSPRRKTSTLGYRPATNAGRSWAREPVWRMGGQTPSREGARGHRGGDQGPRSRRLALAEASLFSRGPRELSAATSWAVVHSCLPPPETAPARVSPTGRRSGKATDQLLAADPKWSLVVV